MSGEVTIKSSSGWQSRLLALIITAAVTLAVMIPIMRTLETRAQTGMMTQIGIAILVPVLIWLLYPQMMKLLPGSAKKNQTLPWSIQNGTLTLGGAVIPQNTIKMVHCWQKEDAWTINIETTGKNYLLRSVEGEQAARSVRQLYALVDALGYRSQWREV